MDEDADLGLDKLFSEEVLRIIMTEPIDPTLFVNVEAELATLSAEPAQFSREELEPGARRATCSSRTRKTLRTHCTCLKKNEAIYYQCK